MNGVICVIPSDDAAAHPTVSCLTAGVETVLSVFVPAVYQQNKTLTPFKDSCLRVLML